MMLDRVAGNGVDGRPSPRAWLALRILGATVQILGVALRIGFAPIRATSAAIGWTIDTAWRSALRHPLLTWALVIGLLVFAPR